MKSRLVLVLPALMILALVVAGISSAMSDRVDNPSNVTLASSVQSELGCPGDWQPECTNTQLSEVGNGVWRGEFTIPAGDWFYKLALNNTWDVSYPASDKSLSVSADTTVRFYFDDKTSAVVDSVNDIVAVAAGSFQSEIGCPGDWQPECVSSLLTDADTDGVYTFVTNDLPVGDFEFKIAFNEMWGGDIPTDNVPFSVTEPSTVTISYDSATDNVSVDVQSSSGLEPGDELLVRGSLRTDLANEVFYFVLPDRFDDGDPSNNTGGDASGDPLINGFLPTDKGYYHGGDLAGLQSQLDYLESLGVTAIWMTPQFTNRPVQGDGTILGSSAAYHGYWQTDYTQIDPHFGTNAEMQALIADAHSRGIKIFFDIVLNHTGDIVTYEEGVFTYRNKTDYPYKDSSGVIFEDRDYAGMNTFPDLDPAVSFPYTPVATDPGAKNPAWLNDPIYYHNRGNSTFTGENSLYGDFYGLDDLFTEHPDVVQGMIDIHKDMITQYGIDGFRVDTVKHVNDEFWQEFVPAILDHAAAQGNPDFFMFGEVYDGNPAFTSRYTTELPFPSVLDFGFDGAATNFAARGQPTDQMRDFFAGDDYYTDSDSNAYGLVKFIGNHDIGRFGWAIDSSNSGASDAERLNRAELGFALSYFSRGIPLIYYGDEQGFTGDGGDKDARQDMMPSQVDSYNDDNLIGTSATTADENFDTTHPLYQTLQELAALRETHVALRQGAQIHRYSQSNAGIYAFARIDPLERVEYLVLFNNSESANTADFAVATPGASFSELYDSGTSDLTVNNGTVTVSMAGLSSAVYRADSALPVSTNAPGINMSAPAAGSEVLGRVEVGASVNSDAYTEVTFAVSVDGGDYNVIGTDDNPPYRVFYDVSGLPASTALTFKAIVNLDGNLNAHKVSVTVGEAAPPPSVGNAPYAVFHYLRSDGDYGDHTTGDYNDFWGLHLWGDIQETIDWTAPKPFLGEDEYGRFAWVRLADNASEVGFIVHRGDVKDGTDLDRFLDPSADGPEIWLKQDDPAFYTSQAAAQGYVTVHYHRADGDYGTPSADYNTYWGLHLWGDAIAPGVGTDWTSPRPFDGIDDFGAYWNIPIQAVDVPVNYIIHRGDTKDPGPDQSFIPADNASVWIQSGDETIYPSRAAAEDTAVLHYHRDDGDYGDYTSADFNDFWGMHVWTGAAAPNPSWQEPLKPVGFDIYGPVFNIPLVADATELAYILHRGDTKDPGPDQVLDLETWGNEVWQLQGAGPDPEQPHYVLPVLATGGGKAGNIFEQRAYWVDENTILWSVATSPNFNYTLHYAPDGGLETTGGGITGGSSITLVPGAVSDAVQQKFPHLAVLPGLRIADADRPLVPEILKGQIAVSAVDADGVSVDATGLQIPGVLDELYTYNGDLGVSWEGEVPTIRVWAPTAMSVTFHLFDDSDPDTTSIPTAMALDPDSGVWSITGEPAWKNKYYLFEVEVYVHSTGQVEHNLVTDPYSFSLSMNSTRSQIVDLEDEALKPEGWEAVEKPPLTAPEHISVYEIHVRDFSVNDPSVPDELKGTYKAFTLPFTNGVNHLKDLRQAGLSHLHLLPVFDIATIDEDKSQWTTPDADLLATYPPDSDQQQVAVAAVADEDGFNWGYDPFHYTTPEGSYSTDPDGTTRILEFREMVQALNEEVGLRVVMDVVYNHTNSSGQAEKSVLDRIVPGYYHRLNDKGAVETSTCCANTASEHNMMEKLMIDSLLVWAKEYKIDAFRFDLMGHHMKRNMLNVRAALDSLTPEADGVDGSAIYMYGEGWNFGEVADNARGENATQLNMGGTGIGTFSDRLRDAVRGGGPFDSGEGLIRNQGFANGLYYDPNRLNSGSQDELNRLLLAMDQIRVGMAGNLATYEFVDRNGDLVLGAQVDYNGQPAGYTLDPQENISYISKHDNQTLWDNNAYKIPEDTPMQERVRIQNVGLSTVILGQGVPFMHAGSDLLRSKSLDRDSYNSGDWFNRLDFTYHSNNWAVGLPVAGVNGDNWPIMQPLLANPDLKPGEEDITFMAQLYRELLAIRASSPLFHLSTAEEIQERLAFHNTGPDQLPGLIVMSISDLTGDELDRYNERIVVLVNANKDAQSISIEDLAGQVFWLHDIQADSVDPVVRTSSFDSETGTFEVPGRTTAVFVQRETPVNLISFLDADIQALIDNGDLDFSRARVLQTRLSLAQRMLLKDRPHLAVLMMDNFIERVELLVRQDVLTEAQGADLIQEAEIIIRYIK